MTYCIFGTTGYNVLDLDFWHVADDDFSQTQFQSAKLKKHPKQTKNRNIGYSRHLFVWRNNAEKS